MDSAWSSAYAGWVGAIGTWAANVLIVVSFVFLRRQILKAQQAIDSAAFQGISAVWIDIDKFFVENPGLRPYFYHGKDLDPLADDETRWRVEAAGEMLLDCFTNIYHQYAHMEFKGFDSYGRFMQATYRDQPTFHRLVDVHAQWLDTAFIRHIRGVAAAAAPCA